MHYSLKQGLLLRLCLKTGLPTPISQDRTRQVYNLFQNLWNKSKRCKNLPKKDHYYEKRCKKWCKNKVHPVNYFFD